MKIVLLTTSILSEESIKYLNRLYESVANNISNGIIIEHVMLLQNPNSYHEPSFEKINNYNLTMLITLEQLALSEARNRMLSFVQDKALIGKNDLVAFPDDDCWYPQSNLAFIYEYFQQKNNLELFFCKYRASNHEAPLEQDVSQNIGVGHVVRNASSNTIFIRGNVVTHLDGFDRNLGVGAPNNGGEDLDYAIRAYLIAKEACFLNRYIVGHRDKNYELRGKYFRGSAIVLKRYMYRNLGLLYEAMRKLAIGVVLTMRGSMPMKELQISLKPVPNDNKIL